MASKLNRRRFLQAGSAAGLGYLFTGPASSVVRAQGANERLKVAGVGVGGKGSSDIDGAAAKGGGDMEVVALCDCDESQYAPKAKKWVDAKTFTDYRKLFDDAIMKQVDAVTISTPDHNHAPVAVRAMLAGKHVYVQKPLTHTVFEARTLREIATKQKVCTQMGNQGSAENGLRKAVELVQSGAIGNVTEIHVWTNRPVWPQAPGVMKRPDEAPVPTGLNWDAFIGPAPQRPYAKYNPKDGRGAYHTFNWRGWWDFGTGALGDMACHTANMAFRACKLGYPTSIVAESTDLNPETYPSSAKVTFQFPKNGEQVPLTFTWYEGKKDGKKVLPPEELVAKAVALHKKSDAKVTALVNSGSILVGDKGFVYSPDDYGANVFFSTGEVTNSGTKPTKIPTNGAGDDGMKKEWAAAIRAGKPTVAFSNFDFAASLTETILLGNIAIKLSGKTLEWDGPNLKFTNNDAATKLVTKEYRKGWELGFASA